MSLSEKFIKESEAEKLARQAISSTDSQRPRYHYQPVPSWMNDPISFFWSGKYHVFYQHSSDGKPYHYQIEWAHIQSDDLVHWENLPAIKPSPDGPDEAMWDKYIAQNIHGGPDGSLYEFLNKKENIHLNGEAHENKDSKPPKPDSYGMWSGSVIEKKGVFYAFYTGYASGATCVATSSDLISWTKADDNRVIKKGRTPGERDPKVWKHGNTWYLIVNTLDLYESGDLYNWKYVKRLEGKCEEFPDFFPLEGKQLLLTHLSGISKWSIGTYNNLQFIFETNGMVDWGNLYAASTMLDDKGRRIMIGWITEGRSIEEQVNAGWSGVLSLPRVLHVLPDNSLEMEPASELESLRYNHRSYGPLQLNDSGQDSKKILYVAEGDCIEICAEFKNRDAAQFGIIVHGIEMIAYDNDKQILAGSPLKLRSEEKIKLHIFVDRSVIEVFANGCFCKTIRSYHEQDDSKAVFVFVNGGQVLVDALDIWDVKCIHEK